MEFSNPKIPEGINTSDAHPLRELAVLLLGALLLLLIFVATLALLADKLAHHIPFEAETHIVERIPIPQGEDTPLRAYLREQAARVARAMDMPEDIAVTLHYLELDTVNAFATLGGHVVVFGGILEKLPHENALNMLLAHELAHVKHRHPIRSLGKGIAVGLGLSLISESAGNGMVDSLMGQGGLLTLMKYSRDHEREADATALATLNALYGHTHGAEDLFQALGDGDEPLEFYSSHPLTENRISRIRASMAESATIGETQRLPAPFTEWVADLKPAEDNQTSDASGGQTESNR